MIPARIPEHTRALGAPRDWDPDRDGTCSVLMIKDVKAEDQVNRMLSMWEMMPDEKARSDAGAKVILSVVGNVHPPVWLTVGEVPENASGMTEEQALSAPGDVRRHKKGGIYRVLLVDTVRRPWAATWAGNDNPISGQPLVLYEHLWPHAPALYQRPQAEFEEPYRFMQVGP